ncbi:20408_t:CDS:2, partial [Gigaspora rosea]
STSDSHSSRPHTKRFLERYFLAGEKAWLQNTMDYWNQFVQRVFQRLIILLIMKYLITSARCFLNESYYQNIYHVAWEQPLPLNEAELDHFGFLVHLHRTAADFALIEKSDNNFKLTPMMRSSINEVNQVIIDKFNYGGFEIPEGYIICICGYESLIQCGPVTLRVAETTIKSVRVERDIGGTVYNIEMPDHGPDEGIPIIVVHGIVTAHRPHKMSSIQPIA